MASPDLTPDDRTPEGGEAESGREVASVQPEVLRALMEDPHSFRFFQAVRLLEGLAGAQIGVGGFGDPTEEVVRFTVNPVLSFPASEIQELEFSESGPAHMMVNFLGLVGPLGVLPYYYTLLVADRVRERDTAMRDFLDIFQHRIISLFFRAWKKHRFEVAFESAEEDHVTRHLLDLIVIGGDGTRNRQRIPDRSLAFYTGLLGPHQRSAVGLEALLGDYFAVPVEVQQFVGGWHSLPEPTQCRLDRGPDPSIQLGMGAVVGDEVWDPHARVRVRLGPLSRERYEEFLPGEEAHESLRSLLRFYGNDSFDFEVQLVLAREEVPGLVLGAAEDQAQPLSWLSWIGTESFQRDPDDTILTL